MKNIDDFRNDVYRRYDEYTKKKAQKRKNFIKYGSLTFAALVTVCVITVPMLSMMTAKNSSVNDGYAYDAKTKNDFDLSGSGNSVNPPNANYGVSDENNEQERDTAPTTTPFQTIFTEAATAALTDASPTEAEETEVATTLALTTRAETTTEIPSGNAVSNGYISVYGAENVEKIYFGDAPQTAGEYFLTENGSASGNSFTFVADMNDFEVILIENEKYVIKIYQSETPSSDIFEYRSATIYFDENKIIEIYILK